MGEGVLRYKKQWSLRISSLHEDEVLDGADVSAFIGDCIIEGGHMLWRLITVTVL